MKHIEVKRVVPKDINLLQDISRRTFVETFSESNTDENMSQYINESLSIPKLISELENESSEFYFAVQDDVVIGYLKLNSAHSQTELKDSKAIEIERIYVLGAYHGKNVGKLLYNKAIEVAQHNDAEYIWLGVWEKNLRAMNFYKKNGFVEFDKHIFKLGDDEQTDIMMRKTLSKVG